MISPTISWWAIDWTNIPRTAVPGFSTSYTYYRPYSEHIASYGFAVMGIDTRYSSTVATHNKEAVEVSQAITWACLLSVR